VKYTKASSYKTRIFLLAIIPLLIMFTLISVINFGTISEEATRDDQHAVQSGLDNYASSLAIYFDEFEHLLKFYADSDLVKNVSAHPDMYETMLENSFGENQKSNDEILMLGYGTITGQYFIHGSGASLPPGYDPRTRPWYLLGAILDQGEFGYTGIYTNLMTGKPVFTVASPVFDDHGKRLGVIAVILNLDKLIEMTETYHIATKGYTFVTHYDTYFIAPDITKNNTSIDIPEVLKISKNRSNALITVTVKGQKLLMASKFDKRTGLTYWSVGYESELIANYYANLRNSVLILLFILAGLIAFILILTNYLSAEISGISEVASTMAKGDFSARMDTNTSLEIKNVAESFNAMADRIEAQTNSMKNNLETLNDSYQETVNLLSNTVEARDIYTAGHCKRVAKSGIMMAEALNFSEHRKKNFEFACLLHDIGKIGIPTEILNKDDSLTQAEMEKFKEHAQIGYFILNDIDHLKGVAQIVLEHHEWVNGKGYPRGVKGEDLLLESKILSIVEMYDNMTHVRPYRKNPLTSGQAQTELRALEGIQFDTDLVELFIRLLEKEGD